MTDQIRETFEAFRATSTEQTRPPGVAAIRRTIARSHAKRATGLAVAAATAVAIAIVPFQTGGGTSPAQQPSASPIPASRTASRPSA